ncbi:aspartate/glutamate racemase family protein [Arenivirga flava]|uniref:Hydantoin racemase n=1 Tax=Arenivirga flava TaxID=1930060 RepID=A0AA37UTX6_9MICO|nr:aspartate/glutamate racemase family protein [Arenivirga flava]GMA28327.1 Asp/Glu racemase [Arenivirga flava]
MRIQLVNPNASRAMTAKIAVTARAVAGPGVEIDAVTNDEGPAALESHTDDALALPGLLRAIERADAGGADAHVIACFGDPGLDAARELARGPVIGIAEAGMHAAALVSRRFAVVTTLARTLGHTRDLTRRYGFGEACAAAYAADIPVLDLEEASPAAVERIGALAERAVHEDGAESIVLGCAGMTDLCTALEVRLGVPVIDGVAAAVGLASALVRMGASTSRREEYAPPPRRPGELLRV